MQHLWLSWGLTEWRSISSEVYLPSASHEIRILVTPWPGNAACLAQLTTESFTGGDTLPRVYIFYYGEQAGTWCGIESYSVVYKDVRPWILGWFTFLSWH